MKENDVMIIKSSFLKGIISKILTREIRKKGYELELSIDDLEASFDGDKVRLQLRTDVSINKDDFKRLFD